MSTGMRLAGLLLLTTSLTFPVIAHAQTADEPEPATGIFQDEDEDGDEEEELAAQPDVSIPGGGIIVTGRRNRDPARNSSQVLTLLSEEDIARTGEGDIAGSLGRVSGLSLVGNGRVFVRGLGDRYSLALLNGLPLPSPEPLSRVVPLDIFPTSIIASSLVQKTYSANFPGEFGGGVINLTTKAIPNESFLDISASISGDTLTTFQNGLTYFGSNYDWFGFDNGNRDIPSNLQAFFNSGERIGNLPAADQAAIAAQLMPLNLVTLQQMNELPANFTFSATGGLAIDLPAGNALGVIANFTLRNKWRNRTVRRQAANSDFSEILESSTNFITDNNVLFEGLVGVGLDIGEHTIRWTNLYIRDTLKTARLEEANNILFGASGFDFINQQTAWFERQLIDSQLVGEFKFNRAKLDLRGGFAQSDREAPFNTNVRYTRTNFPGDPYGDKFVAYFNQLSDAGFTQIAFDDLTEKLWFGGVDFTYAITDDVELVTGYSYSDTSRRSSSREFRPFIAGGLLGEELVPALGLRRPGDIINGATLAGFTVTVTEATPFPVFDAALQIHAGYGLGRWSVSPDLTIEAGVRYEDATQSVELDQTIFSLPIFGSVPTFIANDYFLPSGTITWEAFDNFQLRAAASKTIARPQFRELVEQTYFDPESNRQFRGNPFLQDSTLTNLEARAEYYMGGRKRVSLAGFYKTIDNPIENFLVAASGVLLTSFANAPGAELYGAELDFGYDFDLANLGGDFFATKQLLVLANYTYTQSRLSVGAGDIAPVPGVPNQAADQLFRNGAPLVGQSDHIGNLSIGIEDTEKVQQASFLFNYASKRVTSRGGALPDVVEDPGLTVDFVARSEVRLRGLPLEISFDVRNIFGRDNFEFQEFNNTRIEINSFRVGTSFSLGVKASF